MIVLANSDGSVVNSSWPDTGASMFTPPNPSLDLSSDAMKTFDRVRGQWIENEASYQILREYDSISPDTLMAERSQFIGRKINKKRQYVDCSINFAAMHQGRAWDLLSVRFLETDLFIPVFTATDLVEFKMGLQAWAIAYRMGQVPHTCYVRLSASGAATIMTPRAELRSFSPWRVIDWAETVLADPENDSLDWLDSSAS